MFLVNGGLGSHVGRLSKLAWHFFTIHYSGNNRGTTPRVLLEACIVIGMEWPGSYFMMNKVLTESCVKRPAYCRRHFQKLFHESLPIIKTCYYRDADNTQCTKILCREYLDENMNLAQRRLMLLIHYTKRMPADKDILVIWLYTKWVVNRHCMPNGYHNM